LVLLSFAAIIHSPLLFGFSPLLVRRGGGGEVKKKRAATSDSPIHKIEATVPKKC
jgi:hypothetical protein